MFVVNTHSVYQLRAPRLPSYHPFSVEGPVYALVPEPALADPVQLARAHYLHVLEEQQAAREAYAAHQLRVFQDEAAVYLQQQQRLRRQVAIEEAQRARHEQSIQARREEELRRRRQEIEEHEFSQALMLAIELAETHVELRHVEHAPVPLACVCAHRNSHRPVPSRPVPAFQPRVRFLPPESSARVPVASPSKPAATPVTLKSAMKPSAPPAPIRIGICASKAESSSASAPAQLQPAAAAAPIRVPIRESKGKASSQVRINVVPSPAQTPLAPADAIAALSLLEADLDALTPTTTSVPLLRHQLNGILESVDAIESGGHDAVREVRRALVRRIEEALAAVESDAVPAATRRSVGVTINEPTASRVEVKAAPQPATPAVPARADATTASVPVASEPDLVGNVEDVPASQESAVHTTTDSTAVLKGYVVEGFFDATPAAPSSPAPASTPAPPDELAVPDPAEPTLVTELAPVVEQDQFIDSAGEESVATSVEQPVASPATTNDDHTCSSNAPFSAVASSAVTVAASDTTSSTATAEPTSPERASPIPIETPLMVSYPPAQTFAALMHPDVEPGSDGEWEKPSGSKGEKSDYEVV